MALNIIRNNVIFIQKIDWSPIRLRNVGMGEKSSTAFIPPYAEEMSNIFIYILIIIKAISMGSKIPPPSAFSTFSLFTEGSTNVITCMRRL